MRIATAQSQFHGEQSLSHQRPSYRVWLEIVLLALASAALHAMARQFSGWPAMSALPLALLALRQGGSSALLGCLLMVALSSAFDMALGNRPEPLAVEHLSPLLIALLCGNFSDYWREKQQLSDAARQHKAQILDEVTQSHHLLMLSHARLEQRVVSGVDSLRASLQRLHEVLVKSAEQEQPLSARGADMLLQFDSLTWVQSASLHMVSSSAGTLPRACAEIGAPPSLDPNNPLIIEAIEKRKMLAVTDFREALQAKGPLAAAPIVDSHGLVRAIVCVYKVPFLAFNQENLALMAVLAAHIGHVISITERTGAVDDERFFKHTVNRACLDAKTFSIPATLVQWNFQPTQMGSSAARFIRDNVRGLDHPLMQTVDGCDRLSLLCSLTDRSEFESMLDRLRQLLSARHAIELDANVTACNIHVITAGDKPEDLLKLMHLDD